MWEKGNLKRNHHYLKVKYLVGKKDILTEILCFIINSLTDHLKIIYVASKKHIVTTNNNITYKKLQSRAKIFQHSNIPVALK